MGAGRALSAKPVLLMVDQPACRCGDGRQFPIGSALGVSGRELAKGKKEGHLATTALSGHGVGPALAAAGERLAVGDQTLVQLEQRVPLEIGLLLDWDVVPDGQGRLPGRRSPMNTSDAYA